jgi:hypothetical protein
MRRETPQLLLDVGIKDINWLFNCVAGVYRLTFGISRLKITKQQRLIFTGLCVSNPLAAIILFAVYGLQ